MTVPGLGLILREMRGGDVNYVLSSWLRSYAEAAEFRSMRRDVYFAMYEPHVKAMLARSTVAIATLPDDPEDVILGWAAIEDDALHYVLAKPRFRRLGVASFLLGDLAAVPATYTHSPPPALERLIPATWTYDPKRRFTERKAAA